MKRWLTVVSVVWLSVAGLSSAAEPSDPLAAKKEAWQKTLERHPFKFPESETGMLTSLRHFDVEGKVHMIFDTKEWWKLTFKFEREGKETLTLTGHTNSVYRTVGNTLYFTHYSHSTTGCTVAAYDLTTGEKKWAIKLKAVGTVEHSAYSNQVTMGMSRLPELDQEGEGAVLITGRESYGDYVEVLDLTTGAFLANKIYRQGFDAPK